MADRDVAQLTEARIVTFLRSETAKKKRRASDKSSPINMDKLWAAAVALELAANAIERGDYLEGVACYD